MLFEGPVAAAADDPDITGAQPAAQLRQGEYCEFSLLTGHGLTRSFSIEQ